MKRILALGAALLFAALLLIHTDAAAAAAGDALVLCVKTIVPSLFPFFVAVTLLTRLGLGRYTAKLFAPFMMPLFHLGGQGAAALLAGILGGYPSGAKTVADLYREGAVSAGEAALLLGFCNTCGAAFLISCVGTVLQNPRAGTWLVLIHILSALLAGVILCRWQSDKSSARALPRSRSVPPGGFTLSRSRPVPPDGFALSRSRSTAPDGLAAAFTSAVSGSVNAILSICGYVVLFRTAAALLPAAVPAWCLGFFEMVSGVTALSPGPGGFVTAAAVTAWGGLSVHCQTFMVAEDVPFTWYWPGKILQVVLATLLALGIALWLY